MCSRALHNLSIREKYIASFLFCQISEKERRFQEAVRQHEAKLLGYAAFLLHGDVSRAQDVVQDCFFKLWQADMAKLEGHEAAWLFKVCRNRVYELVRKDRRLSFLGEKMDEEIPDEQEACPWIADDHERLKHCMERLTPRRQELIRLKFFGNLSYKEMAKLCGCTVNHIGVQLHNAIQTLRKCFESQEEK